MRKQEEGTHSPFLLHVPTSVGGLSPDFDLLVAAGGDETVAEPVVCGGGDEVGVGGWEDGGLVHGREDEHFEFTVHLLSLTEH